MGGVLGTVQDHSSTVLQTQTAAGTGEDVTTQSSSFISSPSIFSYAVKSFFLVSDSREQQRISHHRAEVSFVTSAGHIIQVLPTGAQSGVHVGHLALH